MSETVDKCEPAKFIVCIQKQQQQNYCIISDVMCQCHITILFDVCTNPLVCRFLCYVINYIFNSSINK